MLFGSRDKTVMPTREEALPGRDQRTFRVPTTHEVLGTPLEGPWPAGTEVLYIAMGCFWGAERIMWKLPGVVTTAVGYMGGFTPNPTYEECCTGRTGHAETVWVTYDPQRVSVADLVRVFLENHDPTQGDRQGNDVGSQYRSAIFPTTQAQADTARHLIAEFGPKLAAAGYDPITTEVSAPEQFTYWPAEEEHQHYLRKNPFGYCPVHATGVTCR